MRPTIALMLSDRNVQNAPVIYKTALCCIFLSSDKLLTVRASLKNYN